MNLIAYDTENTGWMKPENNIIPANFSSILFDNGHRFWVGGRLHQAAFCTPEEAEAIAAGAPTQSQVDEANRQREEREKADAEKAEAELQKSLTPPEPETKKKR